MQGRYAEGKRGPLTPKKTCSSTGSKAQKYLSNSHPLISWSETKTNMA